VNWWAIYIIMTMFLVAGMLLFELYMLYSYLTCT